MYHLGLFQKENRKKIKLKMSIFNTAVFQQSRYKTSKDAL